MNRFFNYVVAFATLIGAFGFSSCEDDEEELKKEEQTNEGSNTDKTPTDGGSDGVEVPVSGKIDGYEYVDLGLPSGLKWATCNIGARSSDNCGKYYAWGEVTPAPNNDYDENCKASEKSMDELKKSGVIDENGNLTPEYDAATQNWGKNWRIPSQSNFDELQKYCTWEYGMKCGVVGYFVRSKINSNWIFLPAAGLFFDTRKFLVGLDGFYWSSTIDSKGYAYAQTNHSDSYSVESNFSFKGLSIRPVTK